MSESPACMKRVEVVKTLDRFIKGDVHGLHYAVSIFIATTLLWILVKKVADTDPIWAVSSMVATSDPMMKQALLMFRARLINTLVGCATGLVFLAVGYGEWQLPFALAVTVLLSSYVIRIPTMWRQAPITAAIVIAGSFEHHSKLRGFEGGLRRVGEVLFGCIVGLLTAWIVSKVWPVPESSGSS